jgi:hypothetical protein
MADIVIEKIHRQAVFSWGAASLAGAKANVPFVGGFRIFLSVGFCLFFLA